MNPPRYRLMGPFVPDLDSCVSYHGNIATDLHRTSLNQSLSDLRTVVLHYFSLYGLYMDGADF